MVETAECAGVCSGLTVKRRVSACVRRITVTEIGVTEVAVTRTTVIEPRVAELMAVRDVGAMVVERAPAVPVISPVAPAPAKSSEEANAKSNAKGKSNAAPKNAGYGIPAGKGDNRRAVHQPRIIGGDVDYFRVGRFDDDRAALRCDLLLFIALQMAILLGVLTQRLDGIGHIVRLVDIRLAQGRSPGEILVHVFKNGRELHQGLYAGIPVLFVDLFSQLFAFKLGVCLHPAVCLDDLRWIRGRGQNLRHHRVGIQSDRRDELLQLLRGTMHGRSRLLLIGLACGAVHVSLCGEPDKQTADKHNKNLFGKFSNAHCKFSSWLFIFSGGMRVGAINPLLRGVFREHGVRSC